MIRLHIIAEGQTEEEFVKTILAEHLADFNVITDVHCVTTKRTKTQVHRGGLGSYQQPKKDTLLWLKQEKGNDVRFTTMLDLYALPNDFPQFDEGKLIDRFPEYDESVQELVTICKKYDSPELINDGETTAPSKRIIQLIPSYKGAKVSVAPLMVQKIGLPTIRSQCPHFNEWLIQLENLNN